MGTVTELRIGNVRCFDGLQSVKTHRITLFVGENGTGKSTALGCYRALAEIASLDDHGEPNYFGQAPFNLETFESIARSGSSQFTIGGSFRGHVHSAMTVDFESNRNGKPIEQKVQIEFTNERGANQAVEMERVNVSEVLRFTTSDFCFDLEHFDISSTSILKSLSRFVRHGYIPYNGNPDESEKCIDSKQAEARASEFARVMTFLRTDLPLPSGRSFFVKSLDHAPLKRAQYYSELPEYLRNMSGHYSDYLADAGRKLKLWTGISIHRNPDNGCDEVLVETPNGWQNLIDTGYGVASALPLLSALYCQQKPTIFLLQQPEVHLHPSAQASLAQIMAESEHEFLIETHSDHIIDRFRICVMDGQLEPDELAIAYCALNADGRSSQIHNLGIDEDGNLSNVPSEYRSFFMEETKRFLGFQQDGHSSA